MSHFEGHLQKFEVVLVTLPQAGLSVNEEKSIFWMDIIQYLGYLFSHEDLKPLLQKMQLIIALKSPTNIKQLQTALSQLQHYWHAWEKRRKVLALFITWVAHVITVRLISKWVLRKIELHWKQVQHQALEKLKKLLPIILS